MDSGLFRVGSGLTSSFSETRFMVRCSEPLLYGQHEPLESAYNAILNDRYAAALRSFAVAVKSRQIY